MRSVRADLTLVDGSKLENGLIRIVPGFDRYAVTEDGRVFSRRRNGWKELVQGTKGEERGNYRMVALYRQEGGKSKRFAIATHILIARVYLGERPEGMIVDHVDTNKQNNHRKNLEYITQAENIIRAIANGTFSPGAIGDGGRHSYRKKAARLRRERIEKINSLANDPAFIDRAIDAVMENVSGAADPRDLPLTDADRLAAGLPSSDPSGEYLDANGDPIAGDTSFAVEDLAQ